MPKFDMNFNSIDGKDTIVLEVFAGEKLHIIMMVMDN